MPKNSETYAKDMTALATAVQSTSVKLADFAKVRAAFDALTPDAARQVVTRNRTISGHGKVSQLTLVRAFIFLRDVTNLYNVQPLEKVLQGEVDGYMASDPQLPKGLISAYTTELIKAQTTFQAHLDATPPERPKIVTGGYKISTETKSLVSGVLTQRINHDTLVKSHYTSAHAASTAWTNAKVALLSEYTRTLGVSLSNFVSLLTAADTAYDVFKEFFKAVGNENQAKIDMAGCLFKALEDYAPWPVSLIGKVGGAVVGQFHAPKDLLVGRKLEGPQYFNSDAPLLAKANAKLEAIKNWKTDLTRIGVAPSALPTSSSLKIMFDSAKGSAIRALDKIYTDALADEYGDTPLEVEAKWKAFYLKVSQSMPGAMDMQLSSLVVLKINKVCTEYKTALQKTMGTLAILDAETLQPFIEQYLFACYLEAYVPNDEFAISISDELIKRLEGGKIDLITRKTGSSQTAQIYASNKLPWASGHPKHVGALVLYFRWYKDNINPFKIATGQVSVEEANKACRKTIATLGAAIKDNLETRRLRHDNANWAEVKKRL
jgi:hypothetical protein